MIIFNSGLRSAVPASPPATRSPRPHQPRVIRPLLFSEHGLSRQYNGKSETSEDALFLHFCRVVLEAVGRTKSLKVGRRHASIIYLFTFKFKFRESAWAVEIFSPHQRLTINYKDNTNISILTHPKSNIFA